MVNSYSEYYVVLYSYSEMIPFSIRAWIKSLHRLFICCSCFLEFKYWTKCFNNCSFDFLLLINLEFLFLTLLALDLIPSHGQQSFLESKQCLTFLQIYPQIFRAKMKNELQPTRAISARSFHCKKAPCWLSKFFSF